MDHHSLFNVLCFCCDHEDNFVVLEKGNLVNLSVQFDFVKTFQSELGKTLNLAPNFSQQLTLIAFTENRKQKIRQQKIRQQKTENKKTEKNRMLDKTLNSGRNLSQQQTLIAFAAQKTL